MLKITGTFLDEITHDIPSQNWGEKEWRREFALYQKIGIDTVIIIRAGYQNKCIFPAKSVPNLLPLKSDLAQMFLDLAGEHNLQLFFGTFDSGSHWYRRSYWKEVDLNKAFLDEVGQKYGNHPALAGWYLCHETSKNEAHIIELHNQIGAHCKSIKDVPVLISPFPQGTKQFVTGDAFTLEESLDHWNRIFDETKDVVDICAFQDGQIQYHELPEFLHGVKSIADNHGISTWSNVETFDRDMPIKFPPADWRYLELKMEAATQTAEKIITFEFAHFMSPYSCYASAHNLFKRYCEAHNLNYEEMA
ncbi:DUF4434 domain-containing protein [bacterium]|jgi:hypothetical protein|nr:DUF4434 domain-containing protein [bacterium]